MTYTYADGNISAIKRETGNGNVQNYELSYYDSGDLEEISVGGRTLMVYTYDTNNGLPEAQVYGNVDSIFYTYDNLGRLKTATYDDGRVVTYTYNGEGQLYSVKETGGDSPATYLYTYDIIGNLVASEKKNHNGNTVMRVYQNYDDAGQLVGQTWYVGNTKYSEGYTYNTEDGSLSAMITGTGETVQFSYDDLQRLATSGNGLYTKSYSYRDLSGTRTTSQVSQVQYTGLPTALNYGYTYDSLGNIATYSAPGKGTVTYTYDTLGQLLSAVGDQTYMYTYDSAGNILTANGHTYTYGDSGWKDLLTAYDGQTIAYDDIGNPYSYYNGTRWNFSWENGRSLAAANNGTTSISYAYDANGLRTGKTVGNVTHNYIYASGQLLQETYGDNTMDFFYDANGYPYALKYNDTTYYYITNLQGDVMHMIDAQGNTVASYGYDPYGNIISATGSMAEINPLRYRGYYYDTELEMYYVQSRYYDPTIGRFINADELEYLGISGTVIGYNLYSYCENNPISNADITGHWYENSKTVKLNEHGFSLNVQLCFLSRPYCLAFAQVAIKQYCAKYKKTYNIKSKLDGMNALRIAQELWFHALVYYIGSPIKNVLSKVNISWRKLNSWVISASRMDIDSGDKRAWAFCLTWAAASVIKKSIKLSLGNSYVYDYIIV